MTHEITYDPVPKIVEIKIVGDLLIEEGMAIVDESIQTAREHECFLTLTDFRKGNLKVSATELYSLPRHVKENLVGTGNHIFDFKRAIVVEHDLAEFAFYENVSTNNGMKMKVFHDLETARNWLLQ